MRGRLIHLFRLLRVDTIFCYDPWGHYEENPDHYVTAQVVESACWMAGSSRDYAEQLEAGLKPHGVREKYYFARGPQLINRVVDISATIDQKVKPTASTSRRVPPAKRRAAASAARGSEAAAAHPRRRRRDRQSAVHQAHRAGPRLRQSARRAVRQGARPALRARVGRSVSPYRPQEQQAGSVHRREFGAEVRTTKTEKATKATKRTSSGRMVSC